MKDLRAERSIRKQCRTIYEMALRVKTPTGEGEILTGKAPAQHRDFPSSSPSVTQTPVTCTRPWQSCSHTACSVLYKTSTKLISWSLFLFKEAWGSWGAQPKSAMPTNPSTHTRAQLSAVGICKAQVWFGGCWDGSEDSCSQWADPMTKRKKRRQTQVFNKTFINDFPGRTLDWECNSLGTVLN